MRVSFGRANFVATKTQRCNVVAVSEPDHAIEIVRGKVADFSDDVEDLGRVSRALVRALDLAPGKFIRIDHRYRVSA